VRTYVEGKCIGEDGRERCSLPVVYGLYGSGKTTLLVELCRWCLENGIPALRVNLSEVVKFIKSRRGRREEYLGEDELPRYFEEFYNEKLKELGIPPNKRGVLIVDEVEEAYEDLKKLVIGMSILRGLADKVRTGTLGALVVLGFAPSSVLHEAVLQHATAWRVKIVAVPSIRAYEVYGRYTKDLEVSSKLHAFRNELRELLANTAWWLSKGGRLGWVEMIYRNRVLHGAMKTLNYLAEGGDVRDIGLCFEPPGDTQLSNTIGKTLQVEPVEGIPIFDRVFYRNMLEEVRREFDYAEGLVKVLTCLSGPVSTGVLKALGVDVDPMLRVPEKYVVRSRDVIDLGILVEVYVEALRRVADRLAQRIESRDVANMGEYLRIVLEPWSVRNLVIYDKEELKVLLGEALQLLLVERLEQKLLDISTRIDLDAVLEEARRRSVEEVELPKETFYALRVKTLMSLFPPALFQPLIACSRGKSADALLGELRRYSKLQEYLKEIPELGGEPKKPELTPYVIIDPRHFDDLTRADIRNDIVNGRGVVLLLLSELTKDRELRRKIEREYLKLLNKIVFILDPPPLLAQFLAGLLYSEIMCPDDLDRLTGPEAVMYRMGLRSLKELLSDIEHGYLKFLEFVGRVGRELRNVRKLSELDGRAHSVVGGEHAEYLWTIAAVDDARDYLSKLFESLKQVFEIAEEICKNLTEKECDLTRGFGGALKNGARFLEDSHKGLAEILSRSNASNDLREFLEFLESLLKVYSPRCDENPYEIVKTLREGTVLNIIPRPQAILTLSKYLGKIHEDWCTEPRDPPKVQVDLQITVRSLHERLEEFLDELAKVYDRIRLSKEVKPAKLKSLEEHVRNTVTLLRGFEGLSKYGKTLLKYYLDEKLNDLPNRLSDLIKHVEKGTSHTSAILEYLNEAEKIVKSLEETKALKELQQAFEEDLQSLAKALAIDRIEIPSTKKLGELEEELKNYISRLRKLMEGYAEVAESLKEVRKSLNDIKKVLGL
jgi:tetratricopeptide (TPR) repeat protein